jgi:predicted DCC family thiol-disulfide oxidoreductase YuxK
MALNSEWMGWVYNGWAAVIVTEGISQVSKRTGGGEHLILYDGVCGLCNRLNTFVLPRDAEGVFDFASLQSATGQSLLKRFGRNPEDLNTFYVVTSYRSESSVLLSKAEAGLFVMKALGVPWRWLGLFRVLPIRSLNAAYDLVARNRYRLFGRHETCLLPSAEYRSRFIDV